MKNKSLICLFSIIVLIYGCSGARENWNITREQNNIEAYKTFLEKYPGSEYSEEARAQLEILYEKRDWEEANRKNKVKSYEDFIILYPNSQLKNIAFEKIEKLKVERFSIPKFHKTILADFSNHSFLLENKP